MTCLRCRKNVKPGYIFCDACLWELLRKKDG